MLKRLKLPDNLFKYLAASLLIFIPLYPKFPFVNVPGTYVAIRWEDFLLLLLTIVTAIKFIPRIKSILSDNIIRSILLFLVIGVVSIISGVFLTQTIGFSIGVLHLARRFEYFVPFFSVLAFFPNQKVRDLEFYLKVLMLVVVIAFIYGFGQRYFDFPVIITQNMEYSKGVALRWLPGSHINSTFAGHYDLASFLVLVLPIIISFFFAFKEKASKIIVIIVALSGFWLLLSSVSRISFLSYLLAVFIAVTLMNKFKAAVAIVIISIVLSAFSPNLLSRYKRLIDVVLEVKAQEVTTSPTPVFEDRSSSIRFNVEWPRAARAFVKNPLFGTGYSSIDLATDNDYLRLLGEAGILGFSAFILILFNVSKVLTRAWVRMSALQGIERAFVAGITGGFIGVLTNAFFIDVFEASKFAIIFWFLIGLAINIVRNNLNEQNI